MINVKMKVVLMALVVMFLVGYVSAGSVFYDELNTTTTKSIIGDYDIVSVPLTVAQEITAKNQAEPPKPSDKNDYGLVNYMKMDTTVLDIRSGEKERVDISITYPPDAKIGDEYQAVMNIYLNTDSKSQFMVPLFIKSGASEEVISEPTVIATTTKSTIGINTTPTESGKEPDPVGDLIDGFLGLFGL